MSVIVNQASNEVYFGGLTAGADLVPGVAVVADYSEGTCASPANDGAGDGYGIHLVCNYDSYADTDLTDSKDFVVKTGKYARLKQLQVGDIFTTDQFIGTFADVTVDSVFAVNGTAGSGTIGKWIAVGTRTPVVRVQVIEKTTIYGQNALKFRVIAA